MPRFKIKNCHAEDGVCIHKNTQVTPLVFWLIKITSFGLWLFYFRSSISVSPFPSQVAPGKKKGANYKMEGTRFFSVLFSPSLTMLGRLLQKRKRPVPHSRCVFCFSYTWPCPLPDGHYLPVLVVYSYGCHYHARVVSVACIFVCYLMYNTLCGYLMYNVS